ncbi:hypothetical protein TrLO_g15754 [Triparma laevis f. longispina]|uniref:amino-acid N-acetyltransferase n=1 Tax=Triparma laevis f. longispina TaxID=1714387 RepID=A0A9W7B6H8_9STRA|nr:hypothetical protein TrLO_g15754 [Triparma laevis f. longispina]
MFRGSGGYIARHRGSKIVIHIPGELITSTQILDTLDTSSPFPNNAGDGGGSKLSIRNICDDIALIWLLGIKVVVVIGCRPQVDERMKRRKEAADLGMGFDDDDVEVNRYSNGMRITDSSTLRVVKEEAGYVRFEVERQLARSIKSTSRRGVKPFIFNENGGTSESSVKGGNVVGGNFYSSQPIGVRDGCDYLFSGTTRKIEREAIERSLNSGDIVILTSLGVSPSGEMFNVPSEGLASTVAGALSAEKLIYYLSKGACLRNENEKVVQSLRLSEANQLLMHNNVHNDGWRVQIPQEVTCKNQREFLGKAGWGMTALGNGVKRAHLISPVDGALLQELYTRDGSGTLISRDLYDGIRRAQVEDVNGIYDLITPLVREGNLIERTRQALEKDISTYYVYTRDDLIVATGQLRRYDDEYAEIGCLVVHPDYQRGGRGDAMLGYLERLCLESGATKVFVLSTLTVQFFIERSFRLVSLEDLPESKQKKVDTERGSKVYMKEIKSSKELVENELMWDR